MCRMDISCVFVHHRIPSRWPLSRALRSQRFDEANRIRQEETQALANFISYLRAQENEQKHAMQLHSAHWIADTMSGGSGAANHTQPAHDAATVQVAEVAVAPNPTTTAGSVASYGAIRHRRAHQEHAALNSHVHSLNGTDDDSESGEVSNALSDRIIDQLFQQSSAVSAADEQKQAMTIQVNIPVALTDEKENDELENLFVVVVDSSDEKRMDAMAAESLALQMSLSALHQQLNHSSNHRAPAGLPLAVPSAFSASDYVDEDLLVRPHAVEVAD